MREEEKVFNDYSMLFELKTVLDCNYVSIFSKPGEKIEGSDAQRTFITQMIAIAAYDDAETLGHVLAMILIRGMHDAQTSALFGEKFLDIIRGTEWGRVLEDETLNGITKEAQFVNRCIDTELAWRNPEKANETWVNPLELTEGALQFLSCVSSLITTQREGWKNWKVAKYIDTVADHTVVSQLVAISMATHYANYSDIDLEKVILQLAIDHIPAAKVGDNPLFKMEPEEQIKQESNAFIDIASRIPIYLFPIWERHHDESENKSKESKFAYCSGKLETDLAARLYDNLGLVDVSNQQGNPALKDDAIMQLRNAGCSFSEIWISYSQVYFGYRDGFYKVSEYALGHDLVEFRDSNMT